MCDFLAMLCLGTLFPWKFNQILPSNNQVTLSKNWSAKKSRPSFITQPITGVRICWRCHPGSWDGWKDRGGSKFGCEELVTGRRWVWRRQWIITLYLRFFFMCICECRHILHKIQNKSKVVRRVTFSLQHWPDKVSCNPGQTLRETLSSPPSC
jgi:hypothetical protein